MKPGHQQGCSRRQGRLRLPAADCAAALARPRRPYMSSGRGAGLRCLHPRCGSTAAAQRDGTACSNKDVQTRVEKQASGDGGKRENKSSALTVGMIAGTATWEDTIMPDSNPDEGLGHHNIRTSPVTGQSHIKLARSSFEATTATPFTLTCRASAARWCPGWHPVAAPCRH